MNRNGVVFVSSSASQPNPLVRGFFDQATNTVSYMVQDALTGAAAIVDPVLDYAPRKARTSTASADALLAMLTAQNLELRYILETHVHADHLSAADYLRTKTGAPIVIGAQITQVQSHFSAIFGADDVVPDGSAFDILAEDEAILPLGSLKIRVLHTPGHTPSCVSFVIGDAAFVGDTLFMPDYGTARTDFPGGNAKALYNSIRRILALPPETRLFTGHDYLSASRDVPAWEASVSAQRSGNVHVHDGISEAAFITLRQSRDAGLDAPQLLLPAIQVNIRAGAMPPVAPDGQIYLRLPINRL